LVFPKARVVAADVGMQLRRMLSQRDGENPRILNNSARWSEYRSAGVT
jgi:hypothetical protein